MSRISEQPLEILTKPSGNGDIDEVSVWNIALAENQICADLNKHLAGNETGLVGYWRFDEGTGQTAYDSSSNNNNGQLGTTENVDSQDPEWVATTWPHGIGVPCIAMNALIFPSAGSDLFENDITNIIWNVEGITDDLDGTNLTITRISVCLESTANEIAIVTNDISNTLGQIPWSVPDNLIVGDGNCLLRFEVIDSSSLTNSCIFFDNPFSIVPEPAMITLLFIAWILMVQSGKRR